MVINQAGSTIIY